MPFQIGSPVLCCPINPADAAKGGVLIIHSNGTGGISGHSWIEYRPDAGPVRTYGTWGNDPKKDGTNGLFDDLEITWSSSDASRAMRIDARGEERLLAKVAEYRKLGSDAWKLGAPCSSFARDAWEAATGENLNSNYGPFSTPTVLKESIIAANGGKASNLSEIATQPNTASSASFGSFGRFSGSSINSLGSSL